MAHLKSFMLVFLCVVLSMVDLIGFLHFWNLTVDIISYGCILISIGLCIGMIIKMTRAFIREENLSSMCWLVFQKHSKLLSILLSHFIQHKPLIS